MEFHFFNESSSSIIFIINGVLTQPPGMGISIHFYLFYLKASLGGDGAVPVLVKHHEGLLETLQLGVRDID